MMPLARLCGPDRKVQIADEIRYAAVVDALARGASPIALDEKLVRFFFHAQPWIDGAATRALEKLIPLGKPTQFLTDACWESVTQFSWATSQGDVWEYVPRQDVAAYRATGKTVVLVRVEEGKVYRA